MGVRVNEWVCNYYHCVNVCESEYQQMLKLRLKNVRESERVRI